MPEVRELPAGETRRAARALLELRPQYGDAERLATLIDDVLRPGGYRLLGSFEEGADEASAAAGFRVVGMLAWGRSLYVDDLVTVPEARGRGHADALFTWLRRRPIAPAATRSISTPASGRSAPTPTASTSVTG